MSETGYIAANGKDLIYIFKLKQTGANQTTYYSTNGVDLSNIFQPYDGTSVKASITGFSVGINNDLCNIFQNSENNVNSNFNPFSASLTPTGYTYNIFNVSSSFTVTGNLLNAYILLVGGGGGGGSGFGYNGGGAGGAVTTYSTPNLAAGTYSVQIGLGGKGGPTNPSTATAGNGNQGGTTSFSGPGISLSASGGNGGGGSAKNGYGAGGTNSSSPAYGTGGTGNANQGNIQNNYNPTYPGDGQDGFNYIFQDGTGTSFLFGGGGGAGGRNSSGSPISNTYYGGGGFVGTRNGITFTQFTGGCGGLGSYGISFFPGFDFSFNGLQYNVGSGGGAGGNSSANYAISGGTGNDGTVIIYYPSYIVSGTYNISSDSNYNRIITFTGNGTIQFNANVGQVYCVLVGGGAGGEGGNIASGNSGGDGGNGGGGGQVIQQNLTYQTGTTYNISIGSGGTGAYWNFTNNYVNASNGNLTSISSSILTDPSLNALGGLTNAGGAGGDGGDSATLKPGGDGGNGGGGTIINGIGYGGNGGGGGGGAAEYGSGSGGSAINGGSSGGNGGSNENQGQNGNSSAQNFGGGGGGGGGNGFLYSSSTFGSNGGNGGSGIVIISFNV